MTCPSCQSDAAGEGKFCEECGSSLAKEHPEVAPRDLVSAEPTSSTSLASRAMAPANPVARSGRAKIALDKETVNILLSEFASNDKAKLSYQDGKILTDLGHAQISLDHLPLAHTQLSVDGAFGKVVIAVSELQMKDAEISLELDVGIQE